MPLKRLKTLIFALLTSLTLASPALAAGSLPLAMSVQVDLAGNIAAGCQLHFFVAGTTNTPQNSYADFGLTQTQSNPLVCDQSGRLPMFWLADGLIHIQLTDASGLVIVDTTMQTLGPSSGGGGGGGGGTVDPTTIMGTGDEKIRYGTGPITGWVRENGLTVGNGSSGASERANSDTQNLFVYLYNTDPNLAVSGGRTGNALNDFNASKTIALPDMRGRINGFLADMGNTATTVLTSTYAGCNNGLTTLGSACGLQSHTLALSELPTGITSNNPAQSITVLPLGNSSFAAPISQSSIINAQLVPNGSGTVWSPDVITGANWTATNSFSGNNNIAVTSTNTNGNPHTIVPPIMLKTQYIKL